MLLGGGYDLSIHERYRPFFLGAFTTNGDLVGAISGHRTSPDSFRSRGLFVAPGYRGLGIAHELLFEVCCLAWSEGSNLVWTYPRQSAWPVYHKFGFNLRSDWISDGYGCNAYAVKSIDFDLWRSKKSTCVSPMARPELRTKTSVL